ncbi:hypothetical protein [Marinobacter sp. ATCH36]|uniref:hypothetical protein n=1 Tax=Marinobacter sp. ATCH36 TaxID=2945106 RepID=UPI002021AF37|nr:hypothetical protein [Marinobacter sp. ATCH36]MCL7944668.1 hypothetical protein [Marinobacter sp. ATCH36]
MNSLRIFKAEPIHRQIFQNDQIGLVDSFFLKRQKREPGFNRRMFDEDFANIFSVMNHRSRNRFMVESNDEKLAQTLLINAETRYASNSIDESIGELTEQIALSLVWHGKAYYYLHGNPEIEGVRLASLDSRGIFRLLGNHFQWVPRCLEQDWDLDAKKHSREIRLLDSAKLVRFDLPSSIKQALNTQNRILAILDKHKFAETQFLPKAKLENPNPTSNFDFRIWNDIQERVLCRATRSTGWSGRNYDSVKRSDFYTCHRLIRFRRNQLLLRDSILKQISIQLSRIGRPYNAEFSVAVSVTTQLPTVEELNELEIRLEREDAGFDEILDFCFQR